MLPKVAYGRSLATNQHLVGAVTPRPVPVSHGSTNSDVTLRPHGSVQTWCAGACRIHTVIIRRRPSHLLIWSAPGRVGTVRQRLQTPNRELPQPCAGDGAVKLVNAWQGGAGGQRRGNRFRPDRPSCALDSGAHFPHLLLAQTPCTDFTNRPRKRIERAFNTTPCSELQGCSGDFTVHRLKVRLGDNVHVTHVIYSNSFARGS
jgi:hypothetical protein